ncbi:hypothetical protein BT69DRAFT_1316030 [Atractiella rhizophila]|nr:hypothetical protein BT69DRAFT_1316030 [Atractiella rhizophila]
MYKTTIAFFTVTLLAVFTQAAPSSELGAVKAFEERKLLWRRNILFARKAVDAGDVAKDSCASCLDAKRLDTQAKFPLALKQARYMGTTSEVYYTWIDRVAHFIIWSAETPERMAQSEIRYEPSAEEGWKRDISSTLVYKMYRSTITFFAVALLATFAKAAPSPEFGVAKALEERATEICDVILIEKGILSTTCM